MPSGAMAVAWLLGYWRHMHLWVWVLLWVFGNCWFFPIFEYLLIMIMPYDLLIRMVDIYYPSSSSSVFPTIYPSRVMDDYAVIWGRRYTGRVDRLASLSASSRMCTATIDAEL
ncbi:hypothetical protein BDW42DRAFT_44027 [Aspergillus taichungensis]|uniref:Uncharacterized protein n=1 Tax=Aspergillus taichungensis TaxID=482145 RepID=A0A2J5HE51_9EURO|nr:hypothetical protein BDW42DRAFT_44027 [Aspergillus taichungensis]